MSERFARWFIRTEQARLFARAAQEAPRVRAAKQTGSCVASIVVRCAVLFDGRREEVGEVVALVRRPVAAGASVMPRSACHATSPC